jgi:hypothetical protein
VGIFEEIEGVRKFPFVFFTDLTLLEVEGRPFYTDRLTENKLPTKFWTNREELDVRLESMLVETYPTPRKYLESLHYNR